VSEAANDETAQAIDQTPALGHGRIPHTACENATEHHLSIDALNAGDLCPLSCGGKLYQAPPGVMVRVKGQDLAEVHKSWAEKLRCALCGYLITAEPPKDAGSEKYDAAFKAILALQKFVRIKKVLFKILRQLTLKISPHKTHLGKLGEKGFHFLGAQFFGSRNPRSKNPAGSVTLHLRSSRRALNKVQAMKQMGVPSSDIQSYLVRSSVWWTKSIGNPLSVSDIILQWIHLVETIPSPNAHLRALGMGILFKLLGPGRATALLRHFHA